MISETLILPVPGLCRNILPEGTKCSTTRKSMSFEYQAQSVVYYGIQGVGKTVLLNRIESIADDFNVLRSYIEVKEAGSLIKLLSITCIGFAQTLSLNEALKDKAGKLWSVIELFSVAWNPENRLTPLGPKALSAEFAAAGTGDLTNDLTELLVTLGKCAKQADASIVFCIDDIQYIKNVELEALITAIHRLNQLGCPVLFFCAALPKICKTLGDIKSYTERLFDFIRINPLTDDEAADAIVIPAKEFDVTYTEEAVEKIRGFAKGYPYFIQEMCSTIWSRAGGKQIDADTVTANDAATNERLDSDFFHVSYDRCTPTEKAFMAAMIKCGKLPCTMAGIAKIMGRDEKAIGVFRSSLIRKNLIFSTNYGEVDFMVPQFAAFLQQFHKGLRRVI